MNVWEDVVSQESIVTTFTAAAQTAHQAAQQREAQATTGLAPKGTRDGGADSTTAAAVGLIMTYA